MTDGAKQEDSEEEEAQDQHSASDASNNSEEPFDADDPEGYGDCPQTPPRSILKKCAQAEQSVQKEMRPTFFTEADVPAAGPISDSSAKKRLHSLVQGCPAATADSVTLLPASGSVTHHRDTARGYRTLHDMLLKLDARHQKELLSMHPQLRRYEWSCGQCSMCKEWCYESECTFILTHSCGVVHCGWCYEEDHQGQCMGPGIEAEIEATREALFEKFPQLRTQTPVSGCCAHCLEEVSAVHQFLFQHCCGELICSDCYMDHLQCCEGGASRYDAFVFGDDESSDDHGIGFVPDPRDEAWC